MKKIEHKFQERDIEDVFIDGDSIIFYVINDDQTTLEIPLSDLRAILKAMGYTMVKKGG